MTAERYSISNFMPKNSLESRDILVRNPREPLAHFFTRLWKSYKQLLTTVVYSRVRDHYVTQDIVSTVYVNAFSAYKRGIGATDNVRAWLCTIADNIVNDHFRRIMVSRGAVPYALDDVVDHCYDGLTNRLPIGRFLDIILVRRALHLLQTWNQRQAWVIQRVYFDGYRLHEVAQQMQLTLGAVKALQHRALDHLRDFLKDVIIDPIYA